MKISDLRVVVTGGASGMGRHFVEQLLAEGACVSAWDMNEAGLASLSDVCGEEKLHIARVDV